MRTLPLHPSRVTDRRHNGLPAARGGKGGAEAEWVSGGVMLNGHGVLDSRLPL